MDITGGISDLPAMTNDQSDCSISFSCHGNFGPAEKLVRGTKISGISVRADHFYLKILAPCENNGPTSTTSEFRLLLSCALDRARLLHYGG